MREQRCTAIHTWLPVRPLPVQDVPVGDGVIGVAPEQEGKARRTMEERPPENRRACGASRAWCHHGHSLQKTLQYRLQV